MYSKGWVLIREVEEKGNLWLLLHWKAEQSDGKEGRDTIVGRENDEWSNQQFYLMDAQITYAKCYMLFVHQQVLKQKTW
jgi:hypothetical protein